MDTPVLADQQKLTFITFQLCVDTGCRQMDLPRVMGMDGEKEIQENPCCQPPIDEDDD